MSITEHSGSKHDWIPLTKSAQGIYLAAIIDPKNPCYNTAEIMECPPETNLDYLREAFIQLYRENEGFRVQTRVQTGRPEQRVMPLDEFLTNLEVLPVISLQIQEETEEQNPIPAAVRGWASELISEPLRTDAGVTVRSAATYYGGKLWVYHSFSHVVADGFAAFNGLSRVAAIYRALSAEKPLPTVKRVSLMELLRADHAAEHAREEDLALWTSEQAEVLSQPDTSLAARSASPAPQALREVLTLPDKLQRDMLEIGKMYGTSWPVTVTGAVGSYLARIGGHRSAAFGIPQMNRIFGAQVPAETRALGKTSAQTGTTAVNVLPVQVSGMGSIAQALDSVKNQYARNASHPLARQEDLERLAQSDDNRLFGAQINVIPFDTALPLGAPTENAPASVGYIHNISAGPVADMTITLRGIPGRGHTISVELDTNPNLYTREHVEFHARHLQNWLESWAQAALEERSMDTLTTALPHEVELLESFNATAHPIEYKTLLQRFQDALTRYPNEPALYACAPDEDGTLSPQSLQAYEFSQVLTYHELDVRARALAKAMLEAGVCPGTAVGLRFHRGLEQYIALYAALYAGFVYVPILPDLPAERVSSMMEDAQCSALVYGSGLSPIAEAELKPANTQSLCGLQHFEFTALTAPVGKPLNLTHVPEAKTFPGIGTALDDTAYILFTSGSTGRPKGVAISHRSIDNRLRWQQSQIPIGASTQDRAGDRILHKTPVSFDVHVWELYWPLQEGAAVVIAAPDGHRDPAYLARVIAEQNVTCLHFVPTMLTAFLETPSTKRTLAEAGFGSGEQQRHVRYLICSGEALQKDQILSAHNIMGVYPLNLYGPTEAAVDVTFWDSSQNPECSTVPIGQPVWNTQTRILDQALQPIPPGFVGELYLSGVQLAVGYQNNPEATAQAFILDNATGERLYRTGDLAEWNLTATNQEPGTLDKNPRGVILYRGRADHQVKLHGQRLELGDIETTLSHVEGVHSAVVLLYTKMPESALAAFLEIGDVSETERNRIVAQARQHCENTLPDYMVPRLWHTMAQFPVSPSGKTDRKNLAQIEFTFDTNTADGPHGLLEQQISEIIAGVLGRSQFGVTEDFFAAGGNSLAALSVIAKIEENLGKTLSIGALFANTTVKGLAAVLNEDSPDIEFAPVLPLREVDSTDSATSKNTVPLFILPPAGGLGWCYAAYLPYLPGHPSVYALQHEAFTNPNAGYAQSLRELAEGYLARIRETLEERQLPSQFSLMGWSVGGTAAVEVAALAETAGYDVQQVTLLDAYPAEQWQGIPEPDEQESFRALLRMGGLPEVSAQTVLDLPQTLERLRDAGSAMGYLPEDKLGVCLESMRASAALMRGSNHLNFGGKVVLIGVNHDDQPYLDAHGWEPHAGSFRTVTLKNGTHPDLVNPERIPEITAEAF